MKNFLLLCLVAVFITSSAIAQNTDSTTYFLDKTAVTSNVLYPVLENDTNALWLRHNGINENLTTAKQVKQAYLELTNYHLITDELPNIETIVKNTEYEINTNKRIPLLMLDMNYHLFKSYAIDSGLIEVIDGKFYDVANRTELPYQQQHLFMAASLVDKLLYDSLTFYIDSNFYFSNTTKPNHFKIDFGDGLGYRTVNFGQTVNVYYPNMTDIANKMIAAPIIKIEAVYPNSAVLKIKRKLKSFMLLIEEMK